MAATDGDRVNLQVSLVSDAGPGVDAAAHIPGDVRSEVSLDAVDPAAWQLPDDDDAPDYTRIATLRSADTGPTYTNASDGGGTTDWSGFSGGPGVGGSSDGGGDGGAGGE